MKVFSKLKWLEKANEQIEKGYLSERERDDALEIWVNDFDGKTYEEIISSWDKIPNEWFI